MKSHYEELGVAFDASDEQIKSAYRKLAMEHHPDRCPGDPDAGDRFKAIKLAYEVLSDPESRERYDKTGASQAPPSLDAEAMDQVADGFRQCIFKLGKNDDPLPAIRKGIAESLTELRRVIDVWKTLSERRGVVRTREGRANLHDGIIDQLQGSAEESIKQLQRKLDVLERAWKMLDDYESGHSGPMYLMLNGQFGSRVIQWKP